MRLLVILPPVEPEVDGCPYAGRGGQHVQHWQSVGKPLGDTILTEVITQRYRRGASVWTAGTCGRG